MTSLLPLIWGREMKTQQEMGSCLGILLAVFSVAGNRHADQTQRTDQGLLLVKGAVQERLGTGLRTNMACWHAGGWPWPWGDKEVLRSFNQQSFNQHVRPSILHVRPLHTGCGCWKRREDGGGGCTLKNFSSVIVKDAVNLICIRMAVGEREYPGENSLRTCYERWCLLGIRDNS